MKTLEGKDIILRALEPADLDFLYALENDESVWEVSHTQTPYSYFVLKQYLDNSHKDIFEVKQLRLVICDKKSKKVLGLIDLFDFNPLHHRVGIGVVIAYENDKQKGYASQAVSLVTNYAFLHLNVHQVYANIPEDNKASIQLFEKLKFTLSGTKKDWLYANGSYKNELQYQLIHELH